MMPTYPAGRYHFDAATRYWRSGATLGPYVPLPPQFGTFRNRGGALTSPGAPPVSDGWVLGVTKPNAPGASGTPVNWAPRLTITSAQTIASGTILEDIRFENSVDFNGTGIQMRRCEVVGRNESMNRPMVRAVTAACNVGPQNLIEQCNIAPRYASNTNDCFQGFNVLSRRTQYYHGVDGNGSYIPPTIGNDLRVTHEGDWIHDLAYFCPDVGGQSTGQTHNDGNQHHNGIGERWEGCLMEAFWAPDFGVGALDPGVYHMNGNTRVWDSGNANSPGVANGPRHANAAFEINQVTGGTADLFSWVNNWVSGGVNMFNFRDTKLAGVRATLTGNRFSMPLGGWNAIIGAASASAVIITASGNRRDDGTPISLAVGDGRYNNA